MISRSYGQIRHSNQGESQDIVYQTLNIKISKINCNLEIPIVFKEKRSSESV